MKMKNSSPSTWVNVWVQYKVLYFQVSNIILQPWNRDVSDSINHFTTYISKHSWNTCNFREIDFTKNFVKLISQKICLIFFESDSKCWWLVILPWNIRGAKSKSWEITVMRRVKNKIFYEEKEKICYQDFEQWTFSLRNEIGMKYGPWKIWNDLSTYLESHKGQKKNNNTFVWIVSLAFSISIFLWKAFGFTIEEFLLGSLKLPCHIGSNHFKRIKP